MRFAFLLIPALILSVLDLNAQTLSYRRGTARCRTAKRPPNILFFLVDELRYPVVYETPDLQQWSQQNLTTMNFLRNNGVNFINHYVGATACTASRATLFTGQYPTLHGVSQTDGAAKSASDSTMYWLSPNTVPTAGNIFLAGQYNTYYIGKWHISHDDLYNPGTQEPVLSYNQTTGVPDPQLQNVYSSANRLGPFGFNNGWIGPEPHGSDPHQSGSSAAIGISGRDVFFADETITLLQQLDALGASNTPPWFIVCSFVNPHDIALYGEITKNYPVFNFTIDASLDSVSVPPAPTANEDLSSKPTAQSSYQTQYQIAFQNTQDTDQYRKLYYSLQQKVDTQMGRVLSALLNSSFRNNTIVVFTSDHGDLLGAHANFQKWFNMYEESIHVPLAFYSPTLLPQGVTVDMITSHIDILPTLCGLAGIDANQITAAFQSSYTDARTLVGRDLSRIVLGKATSGEIQALESPILFMTYDQILTGQYTQNPLGQPYTYVSQPAFINAVITNLDGALWKFAAYFTNTNFTNAPLSCTCSTAITSEATQYEMYNLSADPIETVNLANSSDPYFQMIQAQLLALLLQQLNQQALQPTNSQPFFPIIPPPS